MNPEITMGLIVVVPAVLISLARARAAMVFMALCVGSVLANYVGDSALDMVQLFARDYSASTQAMVQLGLLLLPPALTILFMSRTVSGSKWLFNILPAALVSLAGLFMAVPLLTDGTAFAIYGSETWDKLTQYQALIIGAAALFSLFQLWAGAKDSKHKKRRHSKK